MKDKHCLLEECAICDFIALVEEIREYNELMSMLGWRSN